MISTAFYFCIYVTIIEVSILIPISFHGDQSVGPLFGPMKSPGDFNPINQFLVCSEHFHHSTYEFPNLVYGNFGCLPSNAVLLEWRLPHLGQWKPIRIDFCTQTIIPLSIHMYLHGKCPFIYINIGFYCKVFLTHILRKLSNTRLTQWQRLFGRSWLLSVQHFLWDLLKHSIFCYSFCWICWTNHNNCRLELQHSRNLEPPQRHNIHSILLAFGLVNLLCPIRCGEYIDLLLEIRKDKTLSSAPFLTICIAASPA